jgi:LuxR family maltose regulon positive regulatory protein
MSTPILATKLYIPHPLPKIVHRPRLVERLDQGWQAGRKLSLISAGAGFGKTTLVSEWAAALTPGPSPKRSGESVAWLSLDEGDKDPARFLTYLIAALQSIAPGVGAGVMGALQSPQPPSPESILTSLLNEITAIQDKFVLILDDYHLVDSQSIDQALTFLLEHQPPQMQLVIATREDPSLPLARLRARGQLTELRAADLRFTPTEAAEFLNRVMGLSLSAKDVSALETRTEGWIAGLQLAALSMQGHADTAGFIQSFTGSHHFVLDYLLEEVLHRQPENIQAFLLRTSILERLCGPLCEAVTGTPSGAGQETLETLEHDNLFIVPLDSERGWYRYHHLFGDLLHQRLEQNLTPKEVAELHLQASEWYEKDGLLFDAFRHAVAANDVERAERLIENEDIGMHFRSVTIPVLEWLASLPKEVLDAHPLLWVRSGTLALMAGQTTGVEERLHSAEIALQDTELDHQTRDLIGQIACARATLALTHYDPQAMMEQARRALEYLPPDDLSFLFIANWALATGLMFLGERTEAARVCRESIAISEKSGNVFSQILAVAALGEVQELENQLYQAFKTYQRVLQLSGDFPQPNAGEAHLGLARIHYQWNDLEAAEQHTQQSLDLSHQYDQVIDRFIISEVFQAHLALMRGNVEGAASMLAQTEQTALQKNFTLRLPEIAAERVLVLLQQDDLAAAAALAEQYDLPLYRARVHLAEGEPGQALEVLKTLRQQMKARNWQDELLKAMVLQTVAYQANRETEQALQVLGEALALAEPGGFLRLFVDEGPAMQKLLKAAKDEDGLPKAYIDKLLAAFATEPKIEQARSASLIESLSQRELEVLRLVAQGLSNRQIGEQLFLALDTVKGHNRRIYDKLQVKRRTEAVARARELGLL